MKYALTGFALSNRLGRRVDHDVYPTPGYCVGKLLPHIDFGSLGWKPTTFFEPCKGDGAIIDRVPNSCEKDWCEIRDGKDYLITMVPRKDIIITNPPYILALEFLQKSLGEADTVIYLLRLNFLGSLSRKAFWNANQPTHLFTITPRPKFVNGRSDSCEYGWFIWDRSGWRVKTKKRFLVL